MPPTRSTGQQPHLCLPAIAQGWRVHQVERLDHLFEERCDWIRQYDRAGHLAVDSDDLSLTCDELDSRANQLARYGRPKGVAVDHPSICNFARIAAEVYGIRPRDRVYQWLTIAFDFSTEEIWVPWVCGATLVPKPPGASLLGQDLHESLSERRVTAMCCVPTLLATIEDDLPDPRFLLVSGEACPQDLIARWHLPGRRFLNVYGPTEATVTPTWTELHPDKPVTIGIPLPTYSTVILDVDDPYRALPHGEIDEIGIAGIGLAAESSTVQSRYADPTTGTESNLAEVLAEIVGVERVSVDSHFFDDLGADSMVMARFCARVRKRADLPTVSMKDIYRHPTIRSLATALAEPAPAPIESSVPPSIEVATHAARGGRHRRAPTGTLQYVRCGTLQFLFFLGYSYLAALVAVRGVEWIVAGSGLIDIYLRSVLFGGASFLGLCILPILAKWMLIGRWKPEQIRIWSLAYVRFWVVKSLVRSSPLVLFVGSPLYVLYLRALGAKVGRGVAIFSQNVPVCTDLLSIGEGTVIRKDSFFTCYRAHAGLIETGAVTLGKDVLVGEATVLDIGTSLGDGAQLGHTSSLHVGQVVPDGQRWHGSPAQRTEVDYRAVDPTGCGTLRRAVYTVLQLLVRVLYLPLVGSVLVMLLAEVPQVPGLLGSGPLAFTSWTFYRDALATSFALFLGSVLVGLLVMVTVPRVLSLAIKPDKVYRLYGFHYWVHRAIAGMTNRKFFTRLFGDSSYIVHYLRCLGYNLFRVEQTGSNFGQEVKHETPYLSSVGSGTVVADGLSIINADFSSTSFRVSRVSIGSHNFLGNNIAYPSQGRTGDNCLLATKVMVPVDGEVREGVGLLGSPSFEIPRSVQRDNRLDLKNADELRRRLAAKNKHNAITMGLYLLVRWIYFFGVTLLALAAADLYSSFGASVIALANVLTLLFTVVYFVLVDRAVIGLQALRPQGCSIYDPNFWRHERFWKLCADAYLQVFNGTPFKNVIWRLLGARLGSRVFDDGCFLSERTFTTIGDDCTLNAGSKIQCHSQEDGAFKSDRSTIGAGCTLGVGTFVHYGVTMGEGAVLAPDSFLMKGEEIPQRARWGGNPAREIRDDMANLQVCRDSNDNRAAALVGGK